MITKIDLFFFLITGEYNPREWMLNERLKIHVMGLGFAEAAD